MDLLKDERFKRFFFYGIDNKEEAKEGIIYFSSKEVYNRHEHDDWYQLPNEMLIKEIIDESVLIYRQFYRFVTLNDEYKNFEFDVDIRMLQQELGHKIKELLYNNKMIDTKAGVFITREEAIRLEGNRCYIYGEGFSGEEGWTKQIYTILNDLKKMEQTDKVRYYECWIRTKLQRAISRADEEEISYVKKACQIFEERKKKINYKEQEELR